MLSDFREDSGLFAFSLGYGRTESGDSTYDSFSLGARWRPVDWLQFTATVPYTFIEGDDTQIVYATDPIDDTPITLIERFDYEEDGIGDITVMGWVNILFPFYDDAPDVNAAEGDAETESTDSLEDIGDPSIYLGAGVKLPTGESEATDSDKYIFDSTTKNLTGEYSESFGVLPTRFQLGTGTTDPILAIFYLQRFGRFQPSLGFSYQFSGGENDVGYERSDRYGWNAALKYIAMRTPDCRELFFTGGVSASTAVEKDYDHSEDVTKLGSQPVGRVPDTDGTYSFWSLGVGYDLMKDLTVSLNYTDTISSADERSNYSYDYALSLGLQYRF